MRILSLGILGLTLLGNAYAVGGTQNGLPYTALRCASGHALQSFSPNTQSIYLRYRGRTLHLTALRSVGGNSTYRTGRWTWAERGAGRTGVLSDSGRVLERCTFHR